MSGDDVVMMMMMPPPLLLLFAVSDVVWQALIAGVVTIVLGWMQQRTQSAVMKTAVAVEKTAADAAVKVADVKQTLQQTTQATTQKLDGVKQTLQQTTQATTQKLDGVNTVADMTHMLVNSSMGAQLRLHATTARALANLTHDPMDQAAADLAEKTLAEHLAKQHSVDVTNHDPGSSSSSSSKKEERPTSP